MSVSLLTVAELVLTDSVKGAFSVAGRFSVTGESIFNGNATVTKNVVIGKDLDVHGNTTLTDTVNTGDLSIRGALNLNSNFLYGNPDTGLLGIGTTSPDSSVHIVGDEEKVLHVESTANQTVNILAQTAGGEAVTIGASGGTDTASVAFYGAGMQQIPGASVVYHANAEDLQIKAKETVTISAQTRIDGQATQTGASLIVAAKDPEQLFPLSYPVPGSTTTATVSNGVSVLATDEQEMASVVLATPEGRGLTLGGGADSQSRALGIVSLSNSTQSSAPTVIMREGTDPTTIPCHVGINTYDPNNTYAVNVNGPVEITHQNLTIVCKSTVPQAMMRSAAFSSDGKRGIIVGDYSVNDTVGKYPFYKTTDSGITWSVGYIRLTGDNVDFISAQVSFRSALVVGSHSLVIGGTRNALLFSPDFGDTWHIIPALQGDPAIVSGLVEFGTGSGPSELKLAMIITNVSGNSIGSFIASVTINVTTNNWVTIASAPQTGLIDKLFYNTTTDHLYCLGNQRVFWFNSGTLVEQGLITLDTEFDRLQAWYTILKGGSGSDLPSSSTSLSGLLTWINVVSFSTSSVLAIAAGKDSENQSRLFILDIDNVWTTVPLENLRLGGNSRQWRGYIVEGSDSARPHGFFPIGNGYDGRFLLLGGQFGDMAMVMYVPNLVNEHFVLDVKGSARIDSLSCDALNSSGTVISIGENAQDVFIGKNALTHLKDIVVSGTTDFEKDVNIDASAALNTKRITTLDGVLAIQSLSGGGIISLGANGDMVVIAGGGTMSTETASFENVIVTNSITAPNALTQLGVTTISQLNAQDAVLGNASIGKLTSSLNFAQSSSNARAAGIDFQPGNTASDTGTMSIRASTVEVGNANQTGVVSLNGTTAAQGNIQMSTGKFIYQW